MEDSLKKIIEADRKSSLKAIEDYVNNPMKKALESIEKFRPSIESFHLPELKTPDYYMPEIPSHEEINEYQSAETLIKRLADSIRQWRKKLPQDQQPAILAILFGGIQIQVSRLAVESFHGIRIEGTISGNPCMILAHQATTQLLCYIEKIEKEEQRKKIGFMFAGQEQKL